jgi:cobalamin biosynthesis protein CbiG
MKTLSIGIGCRLHSSAEQIEAAVRVALGTHPFDQIRAVASVDIKADEPGLLEFCARHALPLHLFSREQIAAVPIANASAAVREHFGVDGVCEPCALLAASCEQAAVAVTDAQTAPEVRDVPVEALAQTTPAVCGAAPASAVRLVVPKMIHEGVTVAIAASAIATATPGANHEPPNHAPHPQDLR